MANLIPLVGAGLSFLSSSKQAKATRRAGEASAEALAPFAEPGAGANQAIFEALGQGGPGAQDEAFQNFLNSTGFQSQLRAGSEAITGNQAAAGLLNSGSTLKRLTRFGQDLGQQGFSNFLGQLGGVADRGLSAAQGTAAAVGGAGASAANIAAGGRANALSGLGEFAQRQFGR